MKVCMHIFIFVDLSLFYAHDTWFYIVCMILRFFVVYVNIICLYVEAGSLLYKEI